MLKSLASKGGSWLQLVRLVDQDRRFGRHIAQRLGGVTWEGILRDGAFRGSGVPREVVPLVDLEGRHSVHDGAGWNGRPGREVQIIFSSFAFFQEIHRVSE